MKFVNYQHSGLEIRACPTEGLNDWTLRRQVRIELRRRGGCTPPPHTHTHTLTCHVLFVMAVSVNTEQCLGRFFNTAMDQLRAEYNKEGQRVAFVATSDDFHWIKKHLVDKQAKIYFREELLQHLDLNSMSDQLWYHTC